MNRLRKHASEKVVVKAKSVVKRWKQHVDEEKQHGSASAKVSHQPSPSKPPQQQQQRPSSPKKASPPEIISVADVQPKKEPTVTITIPSEEEEMLASGYKSPTEMNGICIVPNTARTIKTDAVKIPGLGDKLREKSTEMMYTALASNTDAGKSIIIEWHLIFLLCW